MDGYEAEEFRHELILPNEDLPFKLFLFEGKDGNYRRARHWHRAVEIFFVVEGELEFYMNHLRLPLHAMDFVIVNSNEVHSIEAPRPNRTIVVQIPSGCFSEYVDEEEYAVFSRQSEEADLRLLRLIAQMYQIYEKKAYAGELRVRGLFYEMLYLLVTEFMKKEEDQGTIRQKRYLDRLSQITAYMKQNYNQELTLEGVASQFGFSPTYLSRMFRRYVDISYKTYLLNLRTEYGVREMLHTDHSLYEIAIHNGFPDSRAFARAFARRYGCLPSEYRQKRNAARETAGQAMDGLSVKR